MNTFTTFTPLGTANLRECPKVSSKRVGMVTTGEVIIKTGNVSDGWTEIVKFDGVRGWTFPQVSYTPVDLQTVRYADGFDSPVGSVDERRTEKVWPGQWYDANGFGRKYRYNAAGVLREAYHTGADLNLPKDGDNRAQFFSCASGKVLWCKSFPVWGKLIIVEHDVFVGKDGSLLRTWARYAHMHQVFVAAGDVVERGQLLGTIGDAEGNYSPHLHFDLAKTNVMVKTPHHWAGLNYALITANYLDPKAFISENRP